MPSYSGGKNFDHSYNSNVTITRFYFSISFRWYNNDSLYSLCHKCKVFVYDIDFLDGSGSPPNRIVSWSIIFLYVFIKLNMSAVPTLQGYLTTQCENKASTKNVINEHIAWIKNVIYEHRALTKNVINEHKASTKNVIYEQRVSTKKVIYFEPWTSSCLGYCWS